MNVPYSIYRNLKFNYPLCITFLPFPLYKLSAKSYTLS